MKCISIHVPLAGDDDGGAGGVLGGEISIHVPLAGDDEIIDKEFYTALDFYPRPPCGGRRIDKARYNSCTGFLSTSPLRGTTHLTEPEE